MPTPGNRRPLRSRDWPVIRAAARFLAGRDISPNTISIASVVFAAAAGLCLCALPVSSFGGTLLLCWLAGLCVLGRALCNLLDGLVAVEGGRGTKSGELFNDIPDRLADPLILVALGYATILVPWAPGAGWCAALLAVMTAYVRTLARSLGAPADFQGPMAKPHRMAVVMGACVLTPFESLISLPAGSIFTAALLLIIAGCLVTLWRRALTAYIHMENSGHV